MIRTHALRFIAGTLALSCAFGGLYIGSARTARASAAAALQAGAQQPDKTAGAPRQEHRKQAGTERETETPPIVGEAASVLGIDAAALTEQLKAGKSLADVARERGMSEAYLTAKLLKLRIARIDAAVRSGKLDAARAEQMKQRMSRHLSYMVKEKGLPEKHAHHKGHGWKPDQEQLAAMLGMSKDELRGQLEAGKSLADIAAAKGMSRGQLIAKLKEQLTPQLELWVDHKHPAPAGK
jgi:AraC-like DNA-binding protein